MSRNQRIGVSAVNIATRQESRTTRAIYLAIMFPISVFASGLTLLFLVILPFLVVLFYAAILIFLPVYAILGFFAIWLLHFLKISTGIGAEWLQESPIGFMKEKVEGFKKIIKFAFTWLGPWWADDDSSNKAHDYFCDPGGPRAPYCYLALPVENDEHAIRVLDLLPGQKESPIRCRIRHVSLKHGEPGYEAISYRVRCHRIIAVQLC
jgi:hypothetical protein